MKRLYFIINLIAGKAAIAESLGMILDEFTKAGYEVTAHTTQSGDDAVKASRYACENNFDLLVCAGGDGTLSQCIQGVMHSENHIPIGYIPAGTTNDFAKSLGISKDPMNAVKMIISGSSMQCDIGSFNDDYFTYIVAFGAFTNITYETSQQFKNLLGHAAYVLRGLWQLPAIRAKNMRIEFDGNVIEDEFIFGMVTNTSSVAGMLSMNDFRLDDGEFEVLLIKKPANPIQLRQIISSLLNINTELDREYIKCFRTSRITFTSLDEEPPSWTRDGEFGGCLAVNTIANNSKAVTFMVNRENLSLIDDGFYIDDIEPPMTFDGEMDFDNFDDLT